MYRYFRFGSTEQGSPFSIGKLGITATADALRLAVKLAARKMQFKLSHLLRERLRLRRWAVSMMRLQPSFTLDPAQGSNLPPQGLPVTSGPVRGTSHASWVSEKVRQQRSAARKSTPRSSTSAHGDVGEMKSIQEYGRHACMGKRSGGQTWVPNACGHLCEGKLLVGRHCRRL